MYNIIIILAFTISKLILILAWFILINNNNLGANDKIYKNNCILNNYLRFFT